MTWKEFKDHVDKYAPDDQEIDYIDISHPTKESIGITEDDDGCLIID